MNRPPLDPALVSACAALVHKGDPDRFQAVMAAPPPMRAGLFALYAFNLEIARAPWAAREPMLAQMRLQYWRDVIDGRLTPDHDVARALRWAIDTFGLDLGALRATVDAREAEIGTTCPFDSSGALWVYLEGGAGNLLMLAVQAAGGPAHPGARQIGAAQGLARYLQAIPALESAGRQPLPDGRPEALRELAREGLDRYRRALSETRALPRAPLLAAWQTRALLRQVLHDPQCVAAGTLGVSEFRRRGSLMWASIRGLAGD
ncbi:MAG: squalene/phytoene synthase family protein [Paracoccaceae bacterium]